jgi:hypothetical protein
MTVNALRLVRSPLDASPRQCWLAVNDRDRLERLLPLDLAEPREQEVQDATDAIECLHAPPIDGLVGSVLLVRTVVAAGAQQ